MSLPDDMVEQGACFSSDDQYRYWLRRDCGDLLSDANRPLLGLLLNPSKADHYIDDNTVAFMLGLASRRGYDCLGMVNLFAYRATDPGDMPEPVDAIGPNNDEAIRRAIAWCDANGGDILTAYGTGGRAGGREAEVMKILGDRKLLRFGTNRDGTPTFPRGVSRDVELEEWTYQ